MNLGCALLKSVKHNM